MFKKMFMKKEGLKKKNKGFTLVELIVVIAILGVLAAIATPSLLGYINNSKVTADVATAAGLEGSIKRAIANGGIVLTSSAITSTTAQIVAAIATEYPTIPTCQQNADFEFYVNESTYKVEAKASGTADVDIEIGG